MVKYLVEQYCITDFKNSRRYQNKEILLPNYFKWSTIIKLSSISIKYTITAIHIIITDRTNRASVRHFVCVCLSIRRLRPLTFTDRHVVWNERTRFKMTAVLRVFSLVTFKRTRVERRMCVDLFDLSPVS